MAITRLGGANAISGTIPQGNIANASLGAVTALPAAITTGKVLQIQTTNYTGRVTTTSTSFVTASNGLSVDITPSATSSKIYVIVHTTLYNNLDSTYATATIYRDSTNLGNSNLGMTTTWSASGTPNTGTSMTYLDSPSTTSQITYQVYFRSVGSGTSNLNGLDSTQQGTITAFEIAG